MSNSPLFPDPEKTPESLFNPITDEPPVKIGFIRRMFTNQPTLKDRYIWVWYSAGCVVLSLVGTMFGVLSHHWGTAAFNFIMAGLNFWFYRINDRQYENAKKKLSLDK